MLLCLNANGTIVQKVAEPVYQGSNNASTIYVVAPIAPDLGAQLSFTLPNGKKTKPYTAFPVSFFPYQNSDKVIYCWKWLIPEAITAYAGTVKGRISFLNAKSVSSDSGDNETYTYNQTIASAEFEFEVEQGELPAFPDETASAYHEQFITALHNFLQSILTDFTALAGDITQLQEDMPLIVDEVLRLTSRYEIADSYTNSIDEGSLNKIPSIGESALVLVQTTQSGNIYTAKMTITEGKNPSGYYPFELTEVYLLHNGKTDSDVETILGGLTAQEYVNRINKIENDIPLIPNSPITIGLTRSAFETAVSSSDGYTGTISRSNLNIAPILDAHLNLIIRTNDGYIYECSANISEIVSSTLSNFLIKGATKIMLLNNDEKVVALEEEMPLVYDGTILLGINPTIGNTLYLDTSDFNKSPFPNDTFSALGKNSQTNYVYFVNCSVKQNSGSQIRAEITNLILLHNGAVDSLVQTAWQSQFSINDIYGIDIDRLRGAGSYVIYNNANAPVDANGNKVDGLLQSLIVPGVTGYGVIGSIQTQILFGNNSKIYMRTYDLINWTEWQNVGIDTTKKLLSLVPLPSLPDINDQQTLDGLDKSAIYIIPNNDGTPTDDNNYTEYVLVNIGTEQAPVWKWEVFGTLTSGVSLEDYYTKDEIQSLLSNVEKTIPLLYNGIMNIPYTYDNVKANITSIAGQIIPSNSFNKSVKIDDVFYALSKTFDNYILFMPWKITSLYEPNTAATAKPNGGHTLIHNGNTDNKVDNLDAAVWKNSPTEIEYSVTLPKGTYYVKQDTTKNVPATGLLQVLYVGYIYVHVLFATDDTIYMRSGTQVNMSDWKDLSHGYTSIIDNRDKSDPNNSSVSIWFTDNHDTEMRKAFLLNSLLLGKTHYSDGFIQRDGKRLYLPDLTEDEQIATTDDVISALSLTGLVFERFEIASGATHEIKPNGLYMVFSRGTENMSLCKSDGSVTIQNVSQLILMTSPYGDSHVADPDFFVAMGVGVGKANLLAGNLGVNGVEVELDRGSYIKANASGFAVMQMVRP